MISINIGPMRLRNNGRMKALLLAFALCSPSALLAQACAPAPEVMETLEGEYGERVVFSADAGGAVVMFMVNDTSRTWTALVIQAGVACLTASGTGFEYRPAGEEM